MDLQVISLRGLAAKDQGIRWIFSVNIEIVKSDNGSRGGNEV